jgi:LysM repeat protein
MDTISRENNSMLPVGGIIVGVIALLLGGIALVQISKVNKTLTDHQVKIDKIDAIEQQANAAAATADKAVRNGQATFDSTQKAFTDVGNLLGELRTSVTKLEEAAKKPAAVVKGASGPVVAGPGEYVVKGGDSGAKIAREHGVSLPDLMQVNQGVQWTHLMVGQKIKLPSTAKK